MSAGNSARRASRRTRLAARRDGVADPRPTRRRRSIGSSASVSSSVHSMNESTSFSVELRQRIRGQRVGAPGTRVSTCGGVGSAPRPGASATGAGAGPPRRAALPERPAPHGRCGCVGAGRDRPDADADHRAIQIDWRGRRRLDGRIGGASAAPPAARRNRRATATGGRHRDGRPAPRRRRARSLPRRLDLRRLRRLGRDRQRHRRAAQRDQPLVDARLASSISSSATRIMTRFTAGLRELTGVGFASVTRQRPAHRHRSGRAAGRRSGPACRRAARSRPAAPAIPPTRTPRTSRRIRPASRSGWRPG